MKEEEDYDNDDLASSDDEDFFKQVTMRYYSNSSKVFCYRCKKDGHVSRNCIAQIKKSVCTFCLGGNHEMW